MSVCAAHARAKLCQKSVILLCVCVCVSILFASVRQANEEAAGGVRALSYES